MTEQQILVDFPDLELEDIKACLAFAADRERKFVSVPSERSSFLTKISPRVLSVLLRPPFLTPFMSATWVWPRLTMSLSGLMPKTMDLSS